MVESVLGGGERARTKNAAGSTPLPRGGEIQLVRSENTLRYANSGQSRLGKMRSQRQMVAWPVMDSPPRG